MGYVGRHYDPRPQNLLGSNIKQGVGELKVLVLPTRDWLGGAGEAVLQLCEQKKLVSAGSRHYLLCTLLRLHAFCDGAQWQRLWAQPTRRRHPLPHRRRQPMRRCGRRLRRWQHLWRATGLRLRRWRRGATRETQPSASFPAARAQSTTAGACRCGLAACGRLWPTQRPLEFGRLLRQA